MGRVMKKNNLPMKKEKLLEEQKQNFIKALNLRTIVMLIVLLAFNSFAWFIYASQVDTSLTVHVAGWNVDFDGDGSTPFVMNVALAYPGMPTYSHSLNMSNSGEVDAHLSFTITSARVGTDVYDTSQAGVTSDSIKTALANNYPFKITFGLVGGEDGLLSIGEDATFSGNVIWGLDENDDAVDTYWGELASRFYNGEVSPYTSSDPFIVVEGIIDISQ